MAPYVINAPSNEAEKNAAEIERRIGLVGVDRSLMLPNMKLMKVPESVLRITALQRLGLDHNEIDELPDEIGQLVELRTLRLNDNLLSSLPQGFSALIKLQSLHLHANKLRELPLAVWLFPNLKVLSVRGNPIQVLPPESTKIFRIYDAVHVDVSKVTKPHRDIQSGGKTKILDYLGRIYDAKDNHELILTQYSLTVWPDEALSLRGLTNMDLSFNKLKTIPLEAIPSMSFLTSLSLSNNQIAVLPIELALQLPELHTLDISNNFVSVLPWAFVRLTCFKYWPNPIVVPDVRLIGGDDNNNNVSDVRFKKMKQLWTILKRVEEDTSLNGFLDMRQMPHIGFVPLSIVGRKGQEGEGEEEVEQRFNCEDFDNPLRGNSVRSLDLSHQCLETLEEHVGQLISLEKLWVRGNKITVCDGAALSTLSNLTCLALDRNGMQQLDGGWLNQVGPSLTSLSLGRNSLTTLPAEIGTCGSRLRTLACRSNNLTTIPSTIGGCYSLTVLDISRNAIKTLPDSLCSLGSSLTQLRVNNNALEAISEDIIQLSRLRHLHLHSNQLTYLPERIGDLSTVLLELTLHKNPLVRLPLSLALFAADITMGLEEQDRSEDEDDEGDEEEEEEEDGAFMMMMSFARPKGGRAKKKWGRRDSDSSIVSRGEEYEATTAAAALANSPMGSSNNSNNDNSIIEGGNTTPSSRMKRERKKLFHNEPRPSGELQLESHHHHNNSNHPPSSSTADALPIPPRLRIGFDEYRETRYPRRLTFSVDLVEQPSRMISSMGTTATLKFLRSIMTAKREGFFNMYDNFGFSMIPPDLFQIPSLTKLSFRDNKLVQVPEQVFHSLPSLTWIDLTRNQISALPDGILAATHLTNIILDENLIKEIPLWIYKTTHISLLSLGGNPLEMPCKTICEAGLKAVMDYTRLLADLIHSQDVDIAALPSSTVQAFRHHLLVEAEKQFAGGGGGGGGGAGTDSEGRGVNSGGGGGGGMSPLSPSSPAMMGIGGKWSTGGGGAASPKSSLLMSPTAISPSSPSAFKQPLAYSPSLASPTSPSSPSSSSLASSSANLAAVVAARRANRLGVADSLALSAALMDTERYSPGFLESILALRCHAKALVNLPDAELSKMVSLRTMHAEKNVLKEVPPSLEFLGQLSLLELRQNRIHVFPRSVGIGASSLTRIDLGHNQLPHLPETMSSLVKLQTLLLDRNSFTEFPPVLTSLTQLQDLDLSHNTIAALPKELVSLQNTVVNVNHNTFRRMDDAFVFFTSLHLLKLDENGWEFPPIKIVKRGPRSYCSYLSRIFGAGSLAFAAGGVNASDSGGESNSSKKTNSSKGEKNEEYDDDNKQSHSLTDSTTHSIFSSGKKKRQQLPPLSIDLRGMSLDALPPEVFCNAERLTALSLNKNMFVDLPAEIGALLSGSLTALQVQENQLTSFPGALFCLTLLRNLRLQNNRIKGEVPDAFTTLQHLQKVNLSKNEILSLPESLGRMTDLTSLKIHHNQLQRLPRSLHRMVQLRVFDFSHNKVEKLHPLMFHLTNLERLDFEANPIRFPGREAISLGQKGWMAWLAQLDESRKSMFLDLSGRNLSEISPDALSLTNLTRIDLKDNCLKTIPNDFSQLTHLREFVAPRNQLEALPSFVGDCWPRLKSLQLAQNQIHSLGPEIKGLIQLELLNVERNKLHSLPPEIGNLTSLIQIIANDNEIRSIPPSIGRLTLLQRLILTGNDLEELPITMGRLSSLRVLSIAYNRIHTLPLGLADLQQLDAFHFRDGPEHFDVLPLELQAALLQIDRSEKQNRTKLGIRELKLAPPILKPVLGEVEQASTTIATSPSTMSLVSAREKGGEEEEEKEQEEAKKREEARRAKELIHLVNPSMEVVEQGSVAVLDYLGRLNIARIRLELDFTLMKLQLLPPEVIARTEITKLVLAKNHLKGLPVNISALVNLTFLDLSRNEIHDFPFHVLSVTSLQTLLLSNNGLVNLPPRITTLQRLTHLDIQDNSLHELPFAICSMRKLMANTLLIGGNTWTSPDPTIAARGWDFALMYMRRVHACATKTALVGGGGAGGGGGGGGSDGRDDNGASTTTPAAAAMGGILQLSNLQLKSLPEEAVRLTSSTAVEVQLQSNMLVELPNSIGTWTALTVLRLQANQIRALPVTLGKLESLVELHLQDNKLSSLVPGIGQLARLRVLNVQHNELLYLPGSIGRLLALVSLSAHHNVLREIPTDVKTMLNLSELLLSNNNLISLPEEIGELRSLNVLSIEENPIKRLPLGLIDIPYLQRFTYSPEYLEEPSAAIVSQGIEVIFEWMRILQQCQRGQTGQVLSLKHWDLRALPPEILSTRGVGSLDLSFNRFVRFPAAGDEDCFAHLRMNLRELCLDNNDLTMFSPEMCNLPSLTSLSMQNNAIDSIPDAVAQLTKLRRLLLGGNPIGLLPLALVDLRRLELISLDWENIKSPGQEIVLLGWPVILEFLRSVVDANQSGKLMLARRDLAFLPPEIKMLTALTDLDISRNFLPELPLQVTSHSLLTRLNASNNRFQGELSGEVLARLPFLEELYVSDNKIERMPPELALLTRLRRLDLARNKLSSFPSSACNLPLLEEIILDDNHLQVLLGTASLTSLKRLSLAANQVTILPYELGDLPLLEELIVTDNDIQRPPVEVAWLGTKEVKSYLQRLFRSLQTGELDLSHFNLKCVPKEVLAMTFLRRLSLRGNKNISEFPRELMVFPKLEGLDIEETSIVVPPYEIRQRPPSAIFEYLKRLDAIPKLKMIDLSKLKLKGVPPELFGAPLKEINLRENELAALPEDIFCSFNSLTNLFLDYNFLTEIPEFLTALTNLEVLTLSRNQIDRIPPAILRLPRLRVLRANYNRLREIPPYIVVCTSLQELAIRGHAFQTIPASMMTMTWLKSLRIDVKRLAVIRAEDLGDYVRNVPTHIMLWGLDVLLEFGRKLREAEDTFKLVFSEWQLPSLPSDILRLDTLRSLDLSENFITKLRDDIYRLSSLTELNLNKNRIVMLPTSIGQLPLVTLTVQDNLLADLVADLCVISTLKTLKYDGNPLVSPPDPVREMGFKAIMSYLKDFHDARTSGCLRLTGFQLKQIPQNVLHGIKGLQECHLSNNIIGEIPDEIVSLSRLTVLNLDENAMGKLPSCIVALRMLQKLNLSNNRLTHVPAFIGKLKRLEELYFSNNYIEWVSPLVCRLTALKVLSLQSNRITELPIEFSRIGSNLQELSLADNQLTKAPERLELMSGLVDLSLDNNIISTLPDSIWTLTNLKRLQIDHNYLTELSSEISRLTNLVWLSAEYNVLSSLPHEIGCLAKLVKLEVSDNQLEMLPPEIGLLTALKGLEILGNPMNAHPPAYMFEALEDTLLYVRRLFKTKESGTYDVSNLKLSTLPHDCCVSIQELQEHSRKVLDSLDIAERRRLRAAAGISKIHRMMGSNAEAAAAAAAAAAEARRLAAEKEAQEAEAAARAALAARARRRVAVLGRGPAVTREILEDAAVGALGGEGDDDAIMGGAGGGGGGAGIGFAGEFLMAGEDGFGEGGEGGGGDRLLMADGATAAAVAGGGAGNAIGGVGGGGGGGGNNPGGASGRSAGQFLLRLPVVQKAVRFLKKTVFFDAGEEKFRRITEYTETTKDRELLVMLTENLRILERQHRNNLSSFASAPGDGATAAVKVKFREAMGYAQRKAGLRASKKIHKLRRQVREVERRIEARALAQAQIELPPHPEPDCRTYFEKIIELDASGNEFVTLPREIRRLVYLRYLNVKGNALETLPTEIGYLVALQRIDASRNQLQHIPGAIVHLQALEIADFSYNLLKDVPPNMDRLTSLTELNLSRNRCIVLPKGLCTIYSLRNLGLTENRLLGELSPLIGKLTNLETLSVGFNLALQRLPVELGRCAKIRKLRITALELEFPPRQVAACGPQVTLAFLRGFEHGMNTGDLNLCGTSMDRVPKEISNWGEWAATQFLAQAHLDNQEPIVRDRASDYAMKVARVSVPARERWIIGIETVLSAHRAQRNALKKEVIPLHTLELDMNRFERLEMKLCSITTLTVLKMNQNNIRKIPPEVEQLVSLTRLRLNDNVLQTLPEELGNVTSLIELSLMRNKLTLIPPCLGGLKYLRDLRVEGNPLQSPPMSIINEGPASVLRFLHNVHKASLAGGIVDLSEMRMETAPGTLFEIPSLTSRVARLVLARNQLSEIPHQVGCLSRLVELDCSNNQLRSFTPNLFNLTMLRHLQLSNNRLTILPPTIGNCWQLEALIVSHNRMTVLPNSMGGLSALRHLDIRDNQITLMPACLRTLKISYLNVSNNKLKTLSNWRLMKSLESFLIAHNEIDSFHPKMQAGRKITELDAQGNQLRQIPVSIGSLIKLKRLNISSNPLEDVPPTLARCTNVEELRACDLRVAIPQTTMNQMTKLRVLAISSTAAKEVPSSIAMLPELSHFLASDNAIERLPSDLFQLTLLLSLVLNSNSISKLPSAVHRLRSLQELWLGANRLEQLPAAIGGLCSLVELRLEDNSLRVIPPAIGMLYNLKTLWLHHNRLTDVPAAVVNLTGLQVLTLKRNLLRSLPPELCRITTLTELWINENSHLHDLPSEMTALCRLKVLLTDFSLVFRVAELGN